MYVSRAAIETEVTAKHFMEFSVGEWDSQSLMLADAADSCYFATDYWPCPLNFGALFAAMRQQMAGLTMNLSVSTPLATAWSVNLRSAN